MPMVLLSKINDGHNYFYTSKNKQYPPLTIEYRPALPEKCYHWQVRAQAANDGTARTKAQVDLLLGQIKGWNLTDREAVEGQPTPTPLPVTAELLNDLPWQYLDEFVDAVTGFALKYDEHAKKSVSG